MCAFYCNLNYSTTKRKRKKREPVAFSGLWMGVAEGETKVWKQNNNDALDGREGRIKINSSFWLGCFTVRYYCLWETVFLGTGLCVVGEWDREGIRLNFDMSA